MQKILFVFFLAKEERMLHSLLIESSQRECTTNYTRYSVNTKDHKFRFDSSAHMFHNTVKVKQRRPRSRYHEHNARYAQIRSQHELTLFHLHKHCYGHTIRYVCHKSNDFFISNFSCFQTQIPRTRISTPEIKRYKHGRYVKNS